MKHRTEIKYPWYTSYKAYSVAWLVCGVVAVFVDQPLGVAGCFMSAALSVKLSRWQRMP